ncbi:MAG TPA: hypothetical protein VGF25_10050 [Thermoleophilaceae bacterium]
MAVVALLALLLGSFWGLLVGRWVAALPLVGALGPALVLAGPEAAALAAAAIPGFMAGRRLHCVVADEFVAG